VFLPRNFLALLAAALAACGGGSDAVTPTGTIESVPQESQVVVRYDHNGDTLPDVLTLDTSRSPFRIVEVLEGTDSGDPVDRSAFLRDRPIEPAISGAVPSYLAESMQVASETDLDVTNLSGDSVTVTVFE
jgi:hypothetical protein